MIELANLYALKKMENFIIFFHKKMVIKFINALNLAPIHLIL